MIVRIIKALSYWLLDLFCVPIKKTSWYRRKFILPNDCEYPTRAWHFKNESRNFDLVVLGSTGAKWAFDFSVCRLKCMNWAQQPQYLQNDFRVLKNYHSILRHGGHVIVTLMPYSFLYFDDTLDETVRYTKILDGTLLNHKYLATAYRLARFPIFYGIGSLKAIVKEILTKVKSVFQKSLVNATPYVDMRHESLCLLRWWARQFNHVTPDIPIVGHLAELRSRQAHILRDIIDFCKVREYKVAIVILPIAHTLKALLPSQFTKDMIYPFIEEIGESVSLYDYLCDETFSNDTLFSSPLVMNEIGRKLFTTRLIADLGLSHCSL